MSTREIKVVGKTKAGKEIGYRVPEGTNLYQITFTSGGEVPKELQGGWNDIRQMEIAIKHYLAKDAKKKPVKRKGNASS